MYHATDLEKPRHIFNDPNADFTCIDWDPKVANTFIMGDKGEVNKIKKWYVGYRELTYMGSIGCRAPPLSVLKNSDDSNPSTEGLLFMTSDDAIYVLSEVTGKTKWKITGFHDGAIIKLCMCRDIHSLIVSVGTGWKLGVWDVWDDFKGKFEDKRVSTEIDESNTSFIFEKQI